MKNVTGTRFALLNSVKPTCDSMDAVHAWETKLHRTVRKSLSLHAIKQGHPLFAQMLDAPGQCLGSDVIINQLFPTKSTQEAIAMCDALVKTHVLAAHADDSFTCAARHVVKSFQQLRNADSYYSSAVRYVFQTFLQLRATPTLPSPATGASAATPGGSAG